MFVHMFGTKQQSTWYNLTKSNFSLLVLFVPVPILYQTISTDILCHRFIRDNSKDSHILATRLDILEHIVILLSSGAIYDATAVLFYISVTPHARVPAVVITSSFRGPIFSFTTRNSNSCLLDFSRYGAYSGQDRGLNLRLIPAFVFLFWMFRDEYFRVIRDVFGHPGVCPDTHVVANSNRPKYLGSSPDDNVVTDIGMSFIPLS